MTPPEGWAPVAVAVGCHRLPSMAKYLGKFATAEEEARAYDRRAVELRGPKAFVNFPGGAVAC